MAGEADNVLELTTIYATKAQAMRAAQAKWDNSAWCCGVSISLAFGVQIYFRNAGGGEGFKRVIDAGVDNQPGGA
jgi:hypothetical protein